MSGGGSPSPGRRETAASKMRILHKGELTKKGGHRKNWPLRAGAIGEITIRASIHRHPQAPTESLRQTHRERRRQCLGEKDSARAAVWHHFFFFCAEPCSCARFASMFC